MNQKNESVRKFIEAAAPEYWYAYSEELITSAKELRSQLGGQEIIIIHQDATGDESTKSRPVISRAILLLLGVAIENLVKAVLISEDTERLTDGKLRNDVVGHKLSDLGKKCATVTYTKKERELLSLLSDVIPYLGKYPVPLNSDKMLDEVHSSDNLLHDLFALAHRLSLEIYRLNENGLSAPHGVQFNRLTLSQIEGDVYWREPKSMSEIMGVFERKR